MLGSLLEAEGYDVRLAEDGNAALAAVTSDEPDVVLLDLALPLMSGLQVLERLRERWPHLPVVMMSGRATLADAVTATKLGAFHFIEKPLTPEAVLLTLAGALELRRARELSRALAEELGARGRLVGSSAALDEVRRLIDQVARTDARVLITGESGTGKELVAAAIHDSSPRSGGPFVRVNSAAIPRELVESEMFGHEKGAFTGAHKRRLGRFELAEGGTIFLDEIGDIQPATQLKLLRVLQEREFERVGGEETLKADVRVVTATHRDLRAEVAAGRFREDLFYRLHIIPVQLPPLRDRREDVPTLAKHFVEKLAERTRSSARRISPQAMALLARYEWPGNVRELENVIEHALVFARGEEIGVEDLPPVLGGGARVASGVDLSAVEATSLPEVLEELERSLIVAALEKAEGVKAETARLLGIKSSALYYKLEKYGVESADEEASD